jgi:hypothetical protein
MQKPYHIYKATRLYDGHPYCGPSSHGEPMEFESLEHAQNARKRLFTRNPGVDWVIIDTQTGEEY